MGSGGQTHATNPILVRCPRSMRYVMRGMTMIEAAAAISDMTIMLEANDLFVCTGVE